MEEKKDKKKKKTKDERVLFCPFHPSLMCDTCRLYIAYTGSKGERACAVILATNR